LPLPLVLPLPPLPLEAPLLVLPLPEPLLAELLPLLPPEPPLPEVLPPPLSEPELPHDQAAQLATIRIAARPDCETLFLNMFASPASLKGTHFSVVTHAVTPECRGQASSRAKSLLSRA
jgi:hypothetical protein